jgi:hypothetical protein
MMKERFARLTDGFSRQQLKNGPSAEYEAEAVRW